MSEEDKKEDDKTGDVTNRIKPLIMIIGQADKLKKLFAYAKPNDGIKGYHIIPIGDRVLNLFAC